MDGRYGGANGGGGGGGGSGRGEAGGIGMSEGTARLSRVIRNWTVSPSRAMCPSSGCVSASIQCAVEMKYSMFFDSGTSSMRNVRILTPLATARSTSRLICCDELALPEKISTITFAPVIASMIAAPQSTPPWMSRGATQQRMPRASNPAQTASATGLSLLE